MIRPDHSDNPSALIASKKFWHKRPKASQGSICKAAKAGLYQRPLRDEGDKDVIRKFTNANANVKVSAIAPAERIKIQDRVKPVVAKFTPQMDENFVKRFFAGIDAIRKTSLLV